MATVTPMSYRDLLDTVNRDLWGRGDSRLDLPVVLALIDDRGRLHYGRLVACSLGDVPRCPASNDGGLVDLRSVARTLSGLAGQPSHDDSVVTSAARVPPPVSEFPGEYDDDGGETWVSDEEIHATALAPSASASRVSPSPGVAPSQAPDPASRSVPIRRRRATLVGVFPVDPRRPYAADPTSHGPSVSGGSSTAYTSHAGGARTPVRAPGKKIGQP